MGKKIHIDKEALEAAVLGGAILGGGGGGWIEEGRGIGQIALEKGFSEILALDDLPDDAVLLTCSAVGAPSAGSDVLTPDDFVRAVGLFLEKTKLEIHGLISSEIGALGVVNGWIQSSALKIPVIDSPCNGRAHPLGLMGSMGLNRKKDYISLQTAVGGNIKRGNRVESFFRGSLEEVSKKVREEAIKAGGMVAVARNPVPASYVKDAGAPGAISMALEIGKIVLKNEEGSSEEKIKKILDFLQGDFLREGRVEKLSLKTEGGLDIGKIGIREEKRLYELTFWNEYMTLEEEGKRIGTFPDLMMTFDSETSYPIISVQIKEGQEIVVINVPAEKLILGQGVKDLKLLGKIEKAIGKEIVKYRK
jgi:hypothetical protein